MGFAAAFVDRYVARNYPGCSVEWSPSGQRAYLRDQTASAPRAWSIELAPDNIACDWHSKEEYARALAKRVDQAFRNLFPPPDPSWMLL